MKVPLEYYRVFLTVTKAGSFSAASRELFISQSAVSQSIRQLEGLLGVTLFNRSTKQISLTHEGEKLLDHIEPALNLINLGETYLQSTKDLTTGALHIAASDTLCRYYLLPFFKAFHQAYPGVELRITNKTSIACVDLLANNQVDLIITNLPNSALTEDMSVTETYEFHDVFVMHRTFDNPSKYQTLSDLENKPILSLTRTTTTWQYLNRIFEEAGVTLTPAVALTSVDLLIDMAKIGLGIAFVPDFCIQNASDLVVLPLAETFLPRKLGIVTTRKRPLTPAGQAFVDLIQKNHPSLMGF